MFLTKMLHEGLIRILKSRRAMKLDPPKKGFVGAGGFEPPTLAPKAPRASQASSDAQEIGPRLVI